MDVTPFVLTPAALRAALATMRTMGAERDDDAEATAFFIDALNVLEALFDPAHQLGGAAPMQGQALNPAATAPAEPANPEAGTPAPRAPVVPAADPPHLHVGPAPTLAQEEAQPAHADTIAFKPGDRLRCVNTEPMPGGDPAPVVPGGEYIVKRVIGRFVCLKGIDGTLLRASRFIPVAAADPPTPIPELPAGPGSAADTARPSPAAEAPAPITVPEPAPLPVPAAAEHPLPETRHAPPGDRQPLRTQRIALTAKQEARLRELWPDRTARGSAIRDALNAMDGPRITNDGTLYSVAHRLGLGRRSALWAAQDAAASPAAEQDATAPDPIAEPPIDIPPAPAPEDEGPAAPPQPPRPKLAGSQVIPAAVASPGDVKAEAFDAFDRGLTVRDIAADFGEPIAKLSAWQAEWRLTRRKEPAA